MAFTCSSRTQAKPVVETVVVDVVHGCGDPRGEQDASIRCSQRTDLPPFQVIPVPQPHVQLLPNISLGSCTIMTCIEVLQSVRAATRVKSQQRVTFVLDVCLELVRGIPCKLSIPPRTPIPPFLHQALPKATLSPCHSEIAVGPRVFLEENIYPRVIRLLLHQRDPFPGTPKNDGASHEFPTRPNDGLKRAPPLFQPRKRLSDGDALASLYGTRLILTVRES